MMDDNTQALAHSSLPDTSNHGLLGAMVNNSAITLSGTVGGKILFFITQVAIVRLFGFPYFGLLMIGLRATELARIFSSIGLPKGGMRFLSMAISSEEKRNEIPGILFTSFCVPLVLAIPMSALLCWLSPVVSNDLFGNSELTPYLRLLSLAIPFAVVVHLGLDLSRSFRTTKYAVLVENGMLPIARFAFFLMLYLLLRDFYSAVLASVLAYMVCVAAVYGIIRKLLSRLYGPEWNAVDFLKQCTVSNFRPDIVKYSFPLFLSGCVMMIMASTDILMLGYFRTPMEVGVYGAALTIAVTFSSIMLHSMQSIFTPIIAGEFIRGNREGIKTVYFASVRWMYCVGLPFAAFMILAREPVLLAYGPERLERAGWVIAILSTGQMLNCVTGVSGHILSMTGHQMKELTVNTVSLAINVLFNLLFIPKFGIIGAAVATALSHVMLSIPPVIIVQRVFAMQPFTRLLSRLLAFWLLVVGAGLSVEYLTPALAVHVGTAIAAAVILFAANWRLGLLPDDVVLFKAFSRRIWVAGRRGSRRRPRPGVPSEEERF